MGGRRGAEGPSRQRSAGRRTAGLRRDRRQAPDHRGSSHRGRRHGQRAGRSRHVRRLRALGLPRRHGRGRGARPSRHRRRRRGRVRGRRVDERPRLVGHAPQPGRPAAHARRTVRKRGRAQGSAGSGGRCTGRGRGDRVSSRRREGHRPRACPRWHCGRLDRQRRHHRRGAVDPLGQVPGPRPRRADRGASNGWCRTAAARGRTRPAGHLHRPPGRRRRPHRSRSTRQAHRRRGIARILVGRLRRRAAARRRRGRRPAGRRSRHAPPPANCGYD
jgi:hypothetical protein